MKIKKFEDLNIWKLSLRITKEIYDLTAKKEFSKDFSLRDQIRRAIISVSSNIIEGFEKNNNNEFVRFLKISKGSIGETRNQLYIALTVGYITKEEFNKINSDLEDLANQNGKLISYLQKYKKTQLANSLTRNKLINNNVSGFAELPTVIVLSLIILAIGIGLMTRTSTETEMRKTSLFSQESFYLSDSGVDDALLKIARNKLAEPKGVSAFSTTSLRVGISMEGTSTTVSTSTIFSLSKLKGEYKDTKTIIEVSEYGKINTTTASWRQAITKGSFVGALNFDGTNDYVTTSLDTLLTDTIEVWFRPSDNNCRGIVGYNTCPTFDAYQQTIGRKTDGTIFFYVFDGGAKFIYGSTVTQSNQWSQAVAIRDGGTNTSKLYVNGIYQGQVSESSWGGGTFKIGAAAWYSGPSGTAYFNGIIDEVRVYSRVLSPTEIAEHYQGVFKDETGLVGHWSFDKIESNGTVIDKSGQGNTGTLKPSYPDNCPAWIE